MINDIELRLPKLFPKQQEVADSDALIRVVNSGRQSGKTHLALDISIQNMLDGKTVGYLTPEFSLSKKFHKRLLDMLPKGLIVSANKSELNIELITGGVISFFSSNAIDNIRGLKFDFFVLDECAYQEDLEYNLKEVILPTMITTQIDVLLISTPNGFDYFYSMYNKGLNKETGYQSFNYNLYDNPMTTKEQIEFLKSTVSESIWNQEYLAIPSESDSPFGTKFKDNVIQELSTKPPVVIGLDIAFSVDYTVAIGLDEDGAMCLFERLKGEPVLVQQALNKLPTNVPIIIDATGAGKVVYSTLQMTHNVTPFVYNAQNKQRMMFYLQMGVDSGLVKYLPIVAEEMSTMQMNRTMSGLTQFFNKSGYHDDCVQAIALAYQSLDQYRTSYKGFFKPK